MRTRRSPRSSGAVLPLGRGAILAALLVAAQSGCTREFYREWANQDVSEAIFEKSRDPRWRLDMFSIEPPALSRFADPYDPETPPAPPDDVAAEALSPVPQWPSNRLIMPAEGTGYRDLLDYWQRAELAAKGISPDKAPSDPAVTGLPPNMGLGGFPTSPSSDPASRPGIPFEAFPGMANPFVPGTVIGPAGTGAGQPGAYVSPGTAGTGTPPRPLGTGGLPGGAGSRPPRLSPGSANTISPSLSPGSANTAPPRISPGSPGTGGMQNPGGPGASAVGSTARSAQAGGARRADRPAPGRAVARRDRDGEASDRDPPASDRELRDEPTRFDAHILIERETQGHETADPASEILLGLDRSSNG